ncbi:hypothetical protein B0H16DRAFT_1785284 [Mycena metata]|uniref:Glycosyltransferase family 1 protein n=1 Tax=Mycena metata TaxID=1033252 RepID=A0AAD7JN15_9AGAR|nr:hypothetical protein B0H16DRAFT_1785284 [Mycena metata]
MILTDDSDSDAENPPPYQRSSFQIPFDRGFIDQNATVGEDGRIDLDLDSKLGRVLASVVPRPPPYTPSYSYLERRDWRIKLNIVVQVVGSRGDVQPFIALGNELQKHGHRVRLATHNVFEGFVRQSGLEFYPIGGDPAQLMAYMVKNPGLIPSMKSMRGGDVQRKRAMVLEMLEGCWRSCVEPDIFSNAPFVADAIIANPRASRITRAFPHPLANVKSSSTESGFANYLSYGMVEFLTWHGLGGIMNKWRESLDLQPVPMSEGPSLLDTQKIPFTFCWSPALVPKPDDWGSHIDVCGFFFRNPPNYTPPPDLEEFLQAGPPPVYIGFGSIVVDDPARVSALLLQAVKSAGVRAIISRGWSELDGPPSPDVFFVGECPHEWLFQHVSAVVHHGGSGTTACGLLNGKPTTIVPFFGDQPFWGNMVAASGAGPKPIHHTVLDERNLADAITFCLTPEAAAAAGAIANQMRAESGVKTAVASFHANLPLERLKCDVLEDRPAVWKVKKGKNKLRLSKEAAEALVQNSEFSASALKYHETKRIRIENRRWDPVSGATSAGIATAAGFINASAEVFLGPIQAYKDANPRSPPPTASSSAFKLDSPPPTASSPTFRLGSPAPTVSPYTSKLGSLPTEKDGDSNPRFPPSYTYQLALPTEKDEDSNSRSPSPTASFSTSKIGSFNLVPTEKDEDSKPRSPSPTASFSTFQLGSVTSLPIEKGEDKVEGSSGGALAAPRNRSALSTAGAMAAASGRGFGNFFTAGLRGGAVDIPVAFTEGLRGVPKMYGEEVKDYGEVKDWKSGLLVAAKTATFSTSEGVADFFVQPWKGARDEGALGFAKGLGKGTLGVASKSGAGALGLVAYPAQGIYKSIRAFRHERTRKMIIGARRREAVWLLNSEPSLQARVIARYDVLGLKKNKGKQKDGAPEPP